MRSNIHTPCDLNTNEQSRFVTLRFSCSLCKSLSSAQDRSLYSRVWISCSAGPSVRSINAGRSSMATRDNQPIRTRGASLATEAWVWIKLRILLWKKITVTKTEQLQEKYVCFGTRLLLSGKDCTVSLNLWKATPFSPDQFSSSTAGPSLAASAPGCRSLSSRGTSRTSSDTTY